MWCQLNLDQQYGRLTCRGAVHESERTNVPRHDAEPVPARRPRAASRRRLAMFLAAVTLAGCGSAASHRTRVVRLAPVANGAGETLYGAARGGTLTVYDHADFATFDPGEAYSALDYEVVMATQRPLYSYRPDQTETLSPDLAAGPPLITAGGRVVTVRLRPGVSFGPPVNREVTAADVAYAIERGANPDVATPYFQAYFGHVIGASSASGGPIRGLTTPDRHTIVFHLDGPFATFLVGALSLPLTAPVPREFARALDRDKPTQYGAKYLVATGPYMVAADRSGRFLGIGYRPGRSALLERNPRWRAALDWRPAYLDRIVINIGGDPVVIGRQVLAGHHVVQNDTVAAPIVERAYESYRSQLVAVPGAGLYYVALDNQHGPFANVDVRRALWAALDREALIRAAGGAVTGQIATHFIYPGSSGYAQAGGAAGPAVPYNRMLSGDPTLAARYMRAAGYRDGRVHGVTVSVVGATGNPFAPAASIVDAALRRIGFATNFTLVDQSVMFAKYCGVPRREIDVCPDAGWSRDFADPQTVLDPIFAGYNIVPTGNPNLGQVNDPTINAAMRSAERVVGTAARAQAWAAIDRMLVARAVAIPWDFITNPTIEARDVHGVNDLWNAGYWDYAFTSLR